MTEKRSMPNKIGVVGRKKMLKSDKKIRVDLWKKAGDIKRLGGINVVKSLISEFIDNKISSLVG
jgi:hypothetical protein